MPSTEVALVSSHSPTIMPSPSMSKSIIGGCPIRKNYTFTVPNFAPASNSALFAWTWFNKIGNREMYMNCARVSIQGSGAGSKRRRRIRKKRQNSIDSLPEIYKCNIGAQGNGCIAPDNEDVQFPDPGPNVEHGQDIAGNQGGGSNGSTTDDSNAFNSSGSSSGTSGAFGTSSTPDGGINSFVAVAISSTGPGASTATPSASANSTLLSGCKPKTTSTPRLLPFSTPTVVPRPPSHKLNSSTVFLQSSMPTAPGAFASGAFSSNPSTALPPLAPWLSTLNSSDVSCEPGTMRCDSAITFSQCTAGRIYISMGAVAGGMQCVNGSIVQRNNGACLKDGSIFCNSNRKTCSTCVNGGLQDMGDVAAGMRCVSGKFVAMANW